MQGMQGCDSLSQRPANGVEFPYGLILSGVGLYVYLTTS